ncbi:tripartite tricarboxylate transporter TctB family protein [Vibrio agarivorans]|uniref:Tripartite tricarboxylate transporter TctB family protein n=1 Tax=Vibrio agarivorans TaxID=153622 RepID=A0ABT7Y6P5_9VIBR|nr:tripartite tricarboxylate transporter TctB family protein [Vibrio agarivorans]MDN2483620.1 tripartite tricarboxylate transporter TctB family protein [Vibrio agarivorans]MDN3660598.1 tripartite tricarboxylate transporter TctB family protein [Vibrio agarivorans]
MVNRNVVFPSIVILFAGIALWLISQFDSPMYQDASVDASFFPTLIVVMQIVICIALLVQQKLKGIDKADGPLITKMSLFGIGYLITYAVAINFLGYLYASLIAFVAYLIFFKVKKPLYYAIGLGFVFTVYYLFGQVFYIALPEASWM